MAVPKLTCPECGTVLRPAKPLPAGKKVKCPKCATLFAASEPEPDEPAPRKPQAAPRKASPDGPAGKKSAPAKAAKAADKIADKPAPKKADEDEEAVGTYGYVKEEEPDEEQAEKWKINYAPDMSIKDLRGPAQEAVMGPSNWLLRAGIAGVFGWLGLIVITVIPVLFPPKGSGPEGKSRPAMALGKGLAARAGTVGGGGMGGMGDMGGMGGGQVSKEIKEAEESEAKRSVFSIAGWELEDLVWVIVPVGIIGLIYSGILTLGAVKMQNLESRGWGMTASIMALIPLNILGLQLLLSIFASLLLAILLDKPDVIALVSVQILWVMSIAAGIRGITCLNREEVIEGFEYVPE